MDLVHDLQSAYRKLLCSMSRPGIVSQIGPESTRVGIDSGCHPSTQLVALMLLDNEVSFSVVSPQAVQVSRQLSQLTYAKAAMSDEADYVFILADADAAAVEHAVMTAKTGLLTNPELAATIVLEAKAIIPGEGLALRGPGVELVHFVSIDANGDWVGKRAQQVREFPLGIDMVFLDARGQVVCIPRTTTVEKQVTYGLCSC